jgi:hypothetical protein
MFLRRLLFVTLVVYQISLATADEISPAAICGNGIVETGEDVDPPVSPSTSVPVSPQTCRYISLRFDSSHAITPAARLGTGLAAVSSKKRIYYANYGQEIRMRPSTQIGGMSKRRYVSLASAVLLLWRHQVRLAA